MDQAEMANANHFEPKLPNLDEDHEASHASTTYQTESHTKHTVIDVSMDQFEAEKNEQKSPKNKMVIKIYPPSLQAVASKSPSGANEQKFFEFLFLDLFFFSHFLCELYLLIRCFLFFHVS